MPSSSHSLNRPPDETGGGGDGGGGDGSGDGVRTNGHILSNIVSASPSTSSYERKYARAGVIVWSVLLECAACCVLLLRDRRLWGFGIQHRYS